MEQGAASIGTATSAGGVLPLPVPSGAPSRQTAAAAVPVLPPQLPAQIAAAIADRPERPLELRLTPVELGGLTVNLRNEGDILRVTLQADRPETLDLLRRNGDALLDELRQAGFAGASLSFADGGGARGRPEPEPQPQAAPTATGSGRDRNGQASSLPASAPVPAAQGLDLRL